MRLTRRLCAGLRDVTARNWNIVWKRDGRFFDYPPEIPEALTARGIEVEDLSTPHREPEKIEWTPPVPDDPRFMEPPTLEELPDWKEEPVWTYGRHMRLFEGMKQACIIAKAQHFEGLPPAVDKLVGAVETEDRDLLLQRYIMLSQLWNTEQKKLPKRVCPKRPWWQFKRIDGILPETSSLILMRNLLRLSQNNATKFDSLSSRRQVPDVLLHSHVNWKGTPVMVEHLIEFMVTSDSMLPPFGDENVVEASTGYTVPDMWPVLPTIDFVKTNNYTLKNVAGFSKAKKSLCPHTLLEVYGKDTWDDTHILSKQLMSCLMATAALARQKYGEDVGVLPKPISIQHIGVRQMRLFFTYFQLNTLDLNTDTGVKNLVWTVEGKNLFEKYLGLPYTFLHPEDRTEDRLDSFDGSPYDIFLATYLNGVTELTSS